MFVSVRRSPFNTLGLTRRDCRDPGSRVIQLSEQGITIVSGSQGPWAVGVQIANGREKRVRGIVSTVVTRRSHKVVPEGSSMATRITRDIIESYLSCKYKGHLKLAGESSIKSDYEAMTTAARQASREAAVANLVSRFGEGEACPGVPVTAATLKKGAPMLADATLEDEAVSLRIDALKKADGASKLGDHHYVPVLHNHGEKVGRREKLLQAVLGLALAHVQGLRPAVGLVARGSEGRLGKVRLDAKLYRQAEQVLDEAKRLQAGGEPPRHTLNRHCQVCEFRQRCHKQAEQADDISLLETVGEKELRKLNRTGIFTLTQLSCTFRPRKRGKRVKRTSYNHYPALHALAVREKKVHVYGTPEIPRKPVQVFFDAEGVEGGRFVYLLGVVVAEGDSQKSHSFWADSPADEVQAFDAFLDLLEGYDDFLLFHYGSYEKKLLKRMRKVVKRKKLLDRLLLNAFNIVSAIHASVYFPSFSNGLKDVGRYLGCTWTAEDASGLQSLVWRIRWEQTREQCWKDMLRTYNAEDCAALRKVVEFVQAVADAARIRGAEATTATSSPAVVWADEVAPSIRHQWCRPKFALQDFDHVNRCSYFDYQRDKVFVRTSKAVRRACQSQSKRKKRAKLPVNRDVEITSDVCPFCKGKRIIRVGKEKRVKLAYDLNFTAGGIRRQVIRCTAVRHQCEDCRMGFLPEQYTRQDKHLHGLKSWTVYQHVVHRVSLRQLKAMFEDCFGLAVGLWELMDIKAVMANRYRATCNQILARIVGGGLVHADETHANLKKGKGYAWALANLEDVHYSYRPNREAAFLRDLLKDFKGVLVTDFYSGYDSLPCEQQKCLIHLIRDINNDLKGNPYDEELKTLAGEFGKLLRSIVGTIDQYGLKRYHLHKHKAEVDRFFRSLESCVYRSELAEGYQRRLLKNEGRLFTFLEHDGIPWNNNPGEHAVKAFAWSREVCDGQMSKEGVSDFLVLLSVRQTCKYRGVSFLKFLLSQEEDIEAYCRRGRKKKPTVGLDIYPPGFSRGGRRGKADQGTRTRASQSGVEARGRTVAIGDIHGCSGALSVLLSVVAPRADDTVVTLGNYIDFGTDTKGVIGLLLSLADRCKLVPLKGDHEEMFLAALECQAGLDRWKKAGYEQTLRSYGVDRPIDIPQLHISFLSSCEDRHETDTHLFVHANYRADQPLKHQPAVVLRLKSLDTARPGPHFSGKMAVVGHTPQKSGEILDLGHLVCIDTYCHGGGWLTALDVGSGRWWQANEKGELREGRLASAKGAVGAGQGPEPSATP
jgi:predicted RecB family nuclease